MNNYIKIKNVTKKYNKIKTIKVLNDISFNFESGKTYSIMGPSGSGKSTLLNLLSLIDTPTAGSIEINSIKINYRIDSLGGEKLEEIINKWSPFKTIASLLLWKSIETKEFYGNTLQG